MHCLNGSTAHWQNLARFTLINPTTHASTYLVSWQLTKNSHRRKKGYILTCVSLSTCPQNYLESTKTACSFVQCFHWFCASHLLIQHAVCNAESHILISIKFLRHIKTIRITIIVPAPHIQNNLTLSNSTLHKNIWKPFCCPATPPTTTSNHSHWWFQPTSALKTLLNCLLTNSFSHLNNGSKQAKSRLLISGMTERRTYCSPVTPSTTRLSLVKVPVLSKQQTSTLPANGILNGSVQNTSEQQNTKTIYYSKSLHQFCSTIGWNQWKRQT